MKKLDYVIVFVSDMNRSVRFYRDTFDLPLKFESPHWSEFANEGSTLALHPAPQGGPAPKSKIAGVGQLGFQTNDIQAFHQRMTAAGVTCLTPPKKEDFGTLAVYADPDGLGISVMQLPG